MNWRYCGMDSPPSDQLYISELGTGWQTDKLQETGHAPAEPYLEDKLPLIISSTGLKSSYYANNSLKGLWRHAAQQLSRADELVILGYSMPETDGLVRALVATKFEGVKVTVIDRSQTVARRVADLFGAGRVDATSCTEDEPIPAYVASLHATFEKDAARGS